MTNETYRPTSGGRNAPTSRTYDDKSGSWVENHPDSGLTEETQEPKKVVDNNPKSKVDSKGKADKEFISTEFNTLTGELKLTSTEKSIRIKVNDTIRIEGVGKYLSGLYFVTAVRRSIDKSGGYSHTLSVLKNGFGDSLKKPTKETSKPRLTVVPKTNSSTVKVGDKVKIVGNDAIYSNAHEGVKVPAWVKDKTLTIEQVSADGTRVRLMPINSWTYVKYVQKV